MFGKITGKVRRSKLTLMLLIFTIIVGIFITNNYVIDHDVSTADVTGNMQKVLTIGRDDIAYAAGTPDYISDGIDDDIEIQAALDALSSIGGKICILEGNYNFAATVSRTIDDVVIEGCGSSTYISNNGSTALFSAGSQDGWVFKDLETDAGGITVSSATRCIMQNVNLGSTYYAYWTSSDITGDEFEVPTGRAATYVVAASDAPDNVKAQADFTCDGIDDDIEIQAALGSGDVRVVLSQGNFLGGILDLSYDNITLEGQGASTVYKLADSEDTNVMQAKATNQGDLTGITVKNLTINCNMSNQSGPSSDINGNAIYLKNVDYFSIDSVIMHDGLAHAVALRNCRYGSVTNNRAYQFEGSHGIDLDVENIDLEEPNDTVYCEHINITNNVLVDNGFCGIKLEHSRFITVANNNILQTQVMTGYERGYGIQLSQDSISEMTYLNNISITGNTITGAYIGIIITNLDSNNENISVMGNTIDSTTNDGIAISNVVVPITVSGNSIRNAGVYSIHITSSTYSTVTSNNIVIELTKQGIVLDSSTDCNISDNSILNNGYKTFSLGDGCDRNVFCNNTVYGGTKGFDITSSDHLLITGNNLYNGSQQGLLLKGCHYCIIANNSILNFSQPSISMITSGATECLYNNLRGNVVSNGISEENAADYNIISQNIIKGGTISKVGSNTEVLDNQGFIAPGEVRYISGSLTGGAQDDILFAHQNPETQDCFIIKVVINITSADDSAANIDCGIADAGDGTNLGIEFFSKLEGETVQLNDSWSTREGQQSVWILWEANGSSTDSYVVAQILRADGSEITGSYYIEYVGK